MDERVMKWAEEHEGYERCHYCRFSDGCNVGVGGGQNGPIYPPCADGELEMCLDENAILEVLESEGS